jgi:hypothetical protein
MKLNLIIFVQLLPVMLSAQLEMNFSELLISSRDQNNFSKYCSDHESVLIEVIEDSIYRFKYLENGMQVWKISNSKPTLDKKYEILFTSINHPFNNKYFTKRQILDSVVIANEEYWNMLLEDTSVHSIGIIEQGIFYCPNMIPGTCYRMTSKKVEYAWQYNEETENAAIFVLHSVFNHIGTSDPLLKGKKEIVVGIEVFDNNLFYKFVKQIKSISKFQNVTEDIKFGLSEIYTYYDSVAKKSCEIYVQKNKNDQGGVITLKW